MDRFEYECALSGLIEHAGPSSDSDGLNSLPVGWVKVAITRRAYNPEWVLMQQVKEAMRNGLLLQFPPDQKAVQAMAIDMQIKAQFFPLEQQTPQFLADIEEEVYISDSGDVLESFNELRDMLGLELIPEEEEEEEDEDEDEEDGEIDHMLPHDGEIGDTIDDQPGAK